ncbi:MAG: TolC family protein, partial [Salinibacterium sp.]|nr:TolC family protein [Salinibacterium sp.]
SAALAFEGAQRLYDAGNIVELDLLREQARLGDARCALTSAEVSLRMEREDLNQLLGLWGPLGERWQPASQGPLPTADLGEGSVRGRTTGGWHEPRPGNQAPRDHGPWP